MTRKRRLGGHLVDNNPDPFAVYINSDLLCDPGHLGAQPILHVRLRSCLVSAGVGLKIYR